MMNNLIVVFRSIKKPVALSPWGSYKNDFF
jgi:hypothetical protein